MVQVTRVPVDGSWWINKGDVDSLKSGAEVPAYRSGEANTPVRRISRGNQFGAAKNFTIPDRSMQSRRGHATSSGVAAGHTETSFWSMDEYPEQDSVR